jgi:hypothetical protein
MLSRRICLGLFLLAWSGFSQDTFEGVERIVAIGDVHGDYNRFAELLRSADLIDAKNVWRGGTAHLVLLGDFLDRGPGSRRVMDLLIELGPQAQAAGGRVHALLGNHEAMNVYGDLRYVSRQEFEAYRTKDSRALRDKAFKLALDAQRANGGLPEDLTEFRDKFEAGSPLGYLEHRLAFLPNGKYGKWLRQQNVMIRINDFLFVHGGISPKYASASRQEVNERVREELMDASKLTGGVALDESGPLWYRGLAQLPENMPGVVAHIDQVLRTQQARHIVIGHTPDVAIMPRFGGRVITVDVGLSGFYRGTPAFLLVEGPACFNVYSKGRVPIPLDGGNVLEYLRAAQALDSSNSKLRSLIRQSTGR